MTNHETADPTAAIEVFARLLCSADIQVYGDEHPTWQKLSRKVQDDYRKAAAWLLPRMTVATRPAVVSVPPPAPQAADRRARYAAAIAEGFRAFDADTTSDAYLDAELLDAVVAVADAEEAELLAAVPVVPPAPRADDQAAVLEDRDSYHRWLKEAETARDEARLQLSRVIGERNRLAAEVDNLLQQEADRIVAHCPDHGTADGAWMDCHCAVADDMRRNAVGPCVAGEQQNETPEAETQQQPAAARQDAPLVEPCPPGCVACATDESHDPAAGVRQDGAPPQGWYRTAGFDQHDDYRTEAPE